MTQRSIFGQTSQFDRATAIESRTIPFVFSTSQRDRHKTVLNQYGWNLENFNRNPVAGYMHNVYGGDLCTPPNPDDVIGKARAWVEAGQLLGEIIFEPADINPQAEKVFQKLLFGSLSMVSVGFIEQGQGRYGDGEEAQGRSNETYYFEGQELLEISVVNIPSNAGAGVRSLRDQAYNALTFIKRTLGNDYSFADIEKMTVGDVIRFLDNPQRKIEKQIEREIENDLIDIQLNKEFEAAQRRHIVSKLNS